MAGINDDVRARIAQTNDLAELIRIYRGFFNPQLGGLAHDTNALAGDKISEMTGLDRNAISSMHDAELVQAFQGQGEKKKIEDLAAKQQGQINTFADDYSVRAKSKREELAAALQKNNQDAFELQNPYILEDLNARGLFRSDTAVNSAQAEAMKELELDRSNKLLAFDTSAFGDEQDLRSGGLSTLLGGDQSALDTALNARRSGLEMAYNQVMSSQEQALAQSLAKKKRRADLNNALIGATGQAGAAAIGG